jgi:uncharacterized protein YhdP
MRTRTLAIAGAVLLLAGLALVVGLRWLVASDAVRRAIERQATAAVGQPVRIGSFGASFAPRVGVRMRQVRVGDPVAVTLDDVRIATGLMPLLRRHVTDAEIIVSNSRVSLPLPFRWPATGATASPPPDARREDGSGAAAGRSAIAAGGSGFVIESIGRIVLRDVQVVTSRATLSLDLESALHGDRLEVRRLIARSEGTQLAVTGDVTSLSKGEGAFTARADHLDLDALLSTLTSLTAATSGDSGVEPGHRTAPPRRAFDYRIDLQARSGQALGVTFRELDTTVRVRPSGARLDPLQVQLFGGEVGGQLMVDAGPAVRAGLQGRTRGLDLPQVLAFAGASPVITGRLASALSLQVDASRPEDLFRSARGTIDLDLTDGVVPGLAVVREVVLAFGRPAGEAPPGNGEAFSRIAGRFTLAGGVLRSDAVVFASRDLDMRGKCSVNLVTGALTVDADLVLSPELSRQAGRDLVRLAREGDRVVLPAKVWGTLAEPKVFVDVEAALARAAKNLATDAAKRTIRSAAEELLRRVKPPR